MNKALSNAILVTLILILMLSAMVDPADAARKPKIVEDPKIPEDDRPWAGIPWAVGIVLAAGTILVSLKNAKRSHLD